MYRLILVGLLSTLASGPATAADIDQADRALISGDYRRAIELFESLIADGDARALVRLAALYQKGEGVKRDMDKAAELYLRAAETGDAEAQFNLGNLYLLGEGVPQDDEWALTFYRLAAQQGHELAARNMLELYRGAGIEAPALDVGGPQPSSGVPAPAVDDTGGLPSPAPGLVAPAPSAAVVTAEITDAPSAELLDDADGAERATPGAQGDQSPRPAERPATDATVAADALRGGITTAPVAETVAPAATLHADVVEVSEDEAEAIKLAREHGIEVELDGPVRVSAARPTEDPSTDPGAPAEPQALPPANPAAGLTAARRALDTEHFEDAFRQLMQLADRGNGEAQYELSRVLTDGVGVPSDPRAALDWLQKSAAGGYPEAQFQLAERYMSGVDVLRDEAMAITLYRAAASNGHKGARERLRPIYEEAGLPMPDFSRPRKPVAVYAIPVAPVAAGERPDPSQRGTGVSQSADGPDAARAGGGPIVGALEEPAVEIEPLDAASAELIAQHELADAPPSPVPGHQTEAQQAATAVTALSRPDAVVEQMTPEVARQPQSDRPGNALAGSSEGAAVAIAAFEASPTAADMAHASVLPVADLAAEPPQNHMVVAGSLPVQSRVSRIPTVDPAAQTMSEPDADAPVGVDAEPTVAPYLSAPEPAPGVAMAAAAQAATSVADDEATVAAVAALPHALAEPTIGSVAAPAAVDAESGRDAWGAAEQPAEKRGIFSRIKGLFAGDAAPALSSERSALVATTAAESPPANDERTVNRVSGRHNGSLDQGDEGGAADSSAEMSAIAHDERPAEYAYELPSQVIAEADQGQRIEPPARDYSIEEGKQAIAQSRFEQAAEIFLSLAEIGNAEAQAHLGYMYYQGEGVQKDLSQAVDWYRRAAVQGNPDAQYNLAVAYAFGEGVAQDDSEAVTWYRRAAEQGSAIAQYSLGVSYALGEGVAQDDAVAARWYKAAGDQGYAAAQYNLAYCYRAGKGVEQNDLEASKWFASAARTGHASAQYSLGYMYRSGKGVQRDMGEAIKWYKLAAAQGHPDALADLASLAPDGI